MEFKIINKIENPLFSRTEVEAEIIDEVTPSLEEARILLAREFNVDDSLIRIGKVRSSFGTNVFVINADIYTSLEEFNRIVKKTKQELKKEEEKRKADEEAKRLSEEARIAQEKASEELMEVSE